MSAARIAHETIFDLRRELVQDGLDDEKSRELLGEAAAIATSAMPQLSAVGQGLQLRWQDERLLDPVAAAATYEELAAEVERVEPALVEQLERLRGIAGELQAMLKRRA